MRGALLGVLLLGAAVGGCAVAGSGGGRTSLPREQASELDALERTIEGEEAALGAIDPAACVDRCRSVDAICEASARICQIAGDVGDELALRCQRAEERCGAARSGTDPGCACATAGER